MQGKLYKTKKGWVAVDIKDRENFISREYPIVEDQVDELQASIFTMVNNDGKDIMFEIEVAGEQKFARIKTL